MSGSHPSIPLGDDEICLLIPANNEASMLGRIVEEARRHVSSIIVVDDGSVDQTGGVAESAGARVITHPLRRGKGVAVRSGLDLILERQYRFVLLMDADGQHDPADIPNVLRAAEGPEAADLVIGCRLRPETRHTFSLVRYVTNLFGCYVLSRITGQEIRDSQSGFRLIRTSLLKSLRLKSAGFEIETEMLIKLCARNIRVACVPVSARTAVGSSHYRSVPDTYRVCMATLRF